MATDEVGDSCLGCRGPLQSLGVEHFRVGGVSGGWAALMGKWAEIGEGLMDMDSSPVETAAGWSFASLVGSVLQKLTATL